MVLCVVNVGSDENDENEEYEEYEEAWANNVPIWFKYMYEWLRN